MIQSHTRVLTHAHTHKQPRPDPRYPPGILPLAMPAQPGLPAQPITASLAADPEFPRHHAGALGHAPHSAGDAGEGAVAGVSVPALPGRHRQAEVHDLSACHTGVGEKSS